MTTIYAQEGVPYRERCSVAIDGVTPSSVGYTAAMRIAEKGELIVALSEGSGLTTTPIADAVQIDIELTAAQTALLEGRTYDYALDLILDGEVELRPLRGKLVIEQDVVSG